MARKYTVHRSRKHPPLGAAIRDAREERGMGIYELAEAVGLSGTTVSWPESGRLMPVDKTLKIATDYLGMPWEQVEILRSLSGYAQQVTVRSSDPRIIKLAKLLNDEALSTQLIESMLSWACSETREKNV